MTEEFQVPSDSQLREQALKFFKENKPKAYREMKADGSLEEVLAMRVKAARDYAQTLQNTGTWAGEAWNRAIRLEILESESD